MQLFVIIFMAIVGLASTAATIGLFALGHHNNWTSDGPRHVGCHVRGAIFRVYRIHCMACCLAT